MGCLFVCGISECMFVSECVPGIVCRLYVVCVCVVYMVYIYKVLGAYVCVLFE